MAGKLARVSLRRGWHVIVPDEPVAGCYSPAGCLLSLVTQMKDEQDKGGVRAALLGLD